MFATLDEIASALENCGDDPASVARRSTTPWPAA
jgi:hypothetical protein